MAQDRALLGRLDTLLQFYHKRNMSLKIIELQWINLPHCSMKIYSHHAGQKGITDGLRLPLEPAEKIVVEVC
jgi:hypothetical protein